MPINNLPIWAYYNTHYCVYLFNPCHLRSDMKPLVSSAYFAPIEYYKLLANTDNILLERCDYYVKQTYRNRCRIATANGVMDLSIPVEKPNGNKTLTRDVRISEHGDWRANHWRAITSAYNSSPFFEYYADDLAPFFEKKQPFLFDFNGEIQQTILDLLDIHPIINYTETFQQNYGESVSDFRETIHPKIESKTVFTPYYQVFQQKFGFIPNLSIIDLLFNMGNEAVLVLNRFQKF